MAIMDSKLEFSDAQALASISSAASSVSTNVVDFSAALKDAWGTAITPDIAEGGMLEFNVAVDTALVGASAGVDCKLVSKAADASISSGATTHATISLAATAAAGTNGTARVPAGTTNRYLGVLYTANGGKLTSAKVNAWLNLDHETPTS